MLLELPSQPQVVSFTPHSLEDVLSDIVALGAATGREAEAAELVDDSRTRLENVRVQSRSRTPRVLCLEWLAPPFSAGHWVPEMVALAGGSELLGMPGAHSARFELEQVRGLAPDILLLMPCGYDEEKAAAEYRQTRFPAWWNDVPAVRNRQVYALNANAYFSRPGPRLFEGVELLQQLLQCEHIPESSPDRWLRL